MRRSGWLAAVVAMVLAAPLVGQAASQNEVSQIFQADEYFSVEGTVRKAESDELELSRQNLPPLDLDVVAQQTQITVDGQPATAQQLEPGMEVRAEFQIAGDDIIATKVEAKSAGGQQQQQQPQQQQQQ